MSESTAQGGIPKGRLEALSDGVYAIVLTLLVIDLKLPELGGLHDDAALREALRALSPKLMAWLLSFWVGGLLWATQQRLLRHLTAVDRTLGRLVLVELGLVSLLPFTTALIGEHGDLPTAATLYPLHLAAIAGLAAWRADHARRRPPLLAGPHAEPLMRWQRGRMLLFTAAALAAAALARWWPAWSMLTLAVLAIPSRRPPD